MQPLDLAVVAILAVAALRGLAIGLAREVLSLAALAGACVAVWFGARPGGEWLCRAMGWDTEPVVAAVLAGVAIGIAVLVLGRIAGRGLRRGARAVGLGWLDRGAGGAFGAAEGALLAALVLLLLGAALGREHELLARSRAYAALETLREEAGDLPAVAAPPVERAL